VDELVFGNVEDFLSFLEVPEFPVVGTACRRIETKGEDPQFHGNLLALGVRRLACAFKAAASRRTPKGA
jgi:hypothetical protein